MNTNWTIFQTFILWTFGYTVRNGGAVKDKIVLSKFITRGKIHYSHCNLNYRNPRSVTFKKFFDMFNHENTN